MSILFGGLLALLAPRLSAQDTTPPPCPAEVLEKAEKADKAAQDKIDELDKTKPKTTKLMVDLERDKAAADADVKLARGTVDRAKQSRKEHEESLTKFRAANPSLSSAGKSAADLSSALDDNVRRTEELRVKLQPAIRAKQKLDNDSQIQESRRKLAEEEADIAKKVALVMPPGTSSKPLDVLRQINDLSYRQHDPSTSPDSDGVIRLAQQLMSYEGFSADPAVKVLRDKMSNAITETKDLTYDPRRKNPWDEMREVGPQLIAAIDRSRGEVDQLNRKALASLDAISKRMREIDPDAADLAEEADRLAAEVEKLEKERATLDLQQQLVTHELELAEADQNVKSLTKILVKLLTDASDLDRELAELKEYDKKLAPLMTDKKSAEKDVESAKAAAEKAEKDMKAALLTAKTDYATNENDLKKFKVDVTKQAEEIKELAKTDSKTARERMAKLRVDVKAKKDAAREKVEKIKSALEKYRRCFTDVEAYVTKTLDPKILALGGTLGAIAGDDKDPFAGLLDIPLDDEPKNDVTKGPVWIRKEPIVSVRGPNPDVSATASSFSITQKIQEKTVSGKLSWDAPPAELRPGEEVTLTMSASGEAYLVGWYNIHCAGKWKEQDNSVSTTKDGKRTGAAHNAAKLVFEFDPPSEPYIQVSAGQEAGTTRWVLVTWVYERKTP